jgi:hypothetical protein
MQYREYDRAGDERQNTSAQRIDSIAKDLREGGVNALREPLEIQYDHKMDWGVLVEGNHRLAAAQKAGITHLPVAITRGGDHWDKMKNRIGAPLNVDRRIVDKSGYMPATIHPGNFQQFEGAR